MAPAPRLFLRKAARADIAEAFQWYEARSTGSGSSSSAPSALPWPVSSERPNSIRSRWMTFGRRSSPAAHTWCIS